jgi:N utilization substance protein B
VTDLPESNAEEQEQPKGEVIQHEPPASDRSLARRLALQILYEVDSAGHDAGKVLAVHLNGRQMNRRAAVYAHKLVHGVMRHRGPMDEVISRYAPEWPLEQMAIVDRNVLRIAIFEFSVDGGTPIGAAIDEAVQLAKLFGADNSASFVNGVLGTLAEDEATMLSLRAPQADEEDEG